MEILVIILAIAAMIMIPSAIRHDRELARQLAEAQAAELLRRRSYLGL